MNCASSNVNKRGKCTTDDDSSSTKSSSIDTKCWVQCENPDCLKWRVISEEIVEELGGDKAWFCYMNTNVLFSSCDTPEEYYKSENRIRKHGYGYAFSILPEGSLVWAKLVGYCKWPAVICAQPASPDYVILDADDDPYYYHVEFLGTQHSIAWVPQNKTDAYGNLDKEGALAYCSQPLSQVSMNRFRIRKKRNRKKLYSASTQRKTSERLRDQLQAAIDEADDLLQQSEIDRLKKCSYRYGTGSKLKYEGKVEIRKKARKRKRRKVQIKIVVGREKRCEQPLQRKCNKSQLKVSNRLEDFVSKEERLIADIQGLHSLEEEFLNDFASFSKRKKHSISGPTWHGVEISFFQIYMSVQDKGGFHKVCANKRWKEVVNECCDVVVPKKSSCDPKAMEYYSKNLLAYEVRVRNQEESESTTTTHTESPDDQRDTASISVNEDDAIKELNEIENLLNFSEEENSLEKLNSDSGESTSGDCSVNLFSDQIHHSNIRLAEQEPLANDSDDELFAEIDMLDDQLFGYLEKI